VSASVRLAQSNAPTVNSMLGDGHLTRRDELKAKARDLERSGQLKGARDIYLGLTQVENPDVAALAYSRVAELDRATNDPSSAAANLYRAVDLFETAGHRNNALALCQRVLELSPHDPATHVKLAELAIEQGYVRLARSSTIELVTIRSGPDLLETATRVAGSFAARFSSDAAFWQMWAEGTVATHGPAEAIDALARLEEYAIRAGAGQASLNAIREQWALLTSQSGGDVQLDPSLGDALVPPTASRSGQAGRAPETIIDLGPGLPGGLDDWDSGAGSTLRLEGFEPTQADSWDWANSSHSDDALPLLDTSGQVESPRGSGSILDFDEVSASADLELSEPLPLLDLQQSDSRAKESAATDSVPADESEEDDAGDPLPLLGEWPASEFDLGAVGAELKAITTREVDGSDPSTHYDLAVAFKDMGLVEESIAQLSAAVAGRFRVLACLEILGELLVARDDHARLARILRLVTLGNPAPDAEIVGVLYWLARSEEALGNPAAARKLLLRVISVDPSFRDAVTRLRPSPTAVL